MPFDADFTNADLRKTKARFGNFSRSNFTGANLAKADFMECPLTSADFTNANLTGSDFVHAKLRGVNFTGATLKSVIFDDALFDHTTVFPEGFVIPEEMKWGGKGKDPRRG
ncbi:pentapeptide repeat-containing protein [Lignipirellula cremea]|uniref:Serine/threonine-protein kinase B n=1 Tax=Lignipirellula cremea TaxID=2528010 RepID=A0A518DSH7_9BACT|nr:pentapeptide repeat-containing protein [Lignipirellula cremea]QDU94797.1 Serine/threonine-protein kinase B [Lignipirellula cremea]